MRSDLSLHYTLYSCKFWSGKIPGDDRCTDGICVHRNLCDAADIRFDCESYQYISVSSIYAADFGSDGGDVSENVGKGKKQINKERADSVVL